MKKVLEQLAVLAATLAALAVTVWFVWALFFAPAAKPEPNCTLPNGDRIYVDGGGGESYADIQQADNEACREVITDYYESQNE